MKEHTLSKAMSGMLRHWAMDEGIDIDNSGWVEVEDLIDAEASWVIVGPWVIAPNAVRHVLRKGEWPDTDAEVQPAIRRTDYNAAQGNLLANAKALEIEAI